MDNVSKKQRSYIMSQVKGKWTKQERLVHNYLKGNKVRHKMHPKMLGNPDIILKNKKVAIFLDGCFWHGCPKCYRRPTSNVAYWKKKIIKNKRNARLADSVLRKSGWEVIRIWEHEINKFGISKLMEKKQLI